MFNPDKKIILGSKSPRRLELLTLMGINFKVALKEVEESFPDGLEPHEIALHIAGKKAKAFSPCPEELVITADTIVSLNQEILGKPADKQHAAEMLRKLSGKTHQVFTGVCLATADKITSFYDRTEVTFRAVSDAEIEHYITHFKPFDKAGSYGVQDWWGLAVVTQINGSYTNVMGLPTEKLFQNLRILGFAG